MSEPLPTQQPCPPGTALRPDQSGPLPGRPDPSAVEAQPQTPRPGAEPALFNLDLLQQAPPPDSPLAADPDEALFDLDLLERGLPEDDAPALDPLPPGNSDDFSALDQLPSSSPSPQVQRDRPLEAPRLQQHRKGRRLAQHCGGMEQLKRLVDRLATATRA